MNHECVRWFFWVRSFQCFPQRSSLTRPPLYYSYLPSVSQSNRPTITNRPTTIPISGRSVLEARMLFHSLVTIFVSQYLCQWRCRWRCLRSFQIKEGRKGKTAYQACCTYGCSKDQTLRNDGKKTNIEAGVCRLSHWRRRFQKEVGFLFECHSKWCETSDTP